MHIYVMLVFVVVQYVRDEFFKGWNGLPELVVAIDVHASILSQNFLRHFIMMGAFMRS